MNKWVVHISAIGLALLLLVLMVGLPLSYDSAQEVNSELAKNDTGDENPYSNSTEEKTSSSSVSVGEEYVHEIRHILFVFPLRATTIYIHTHEAAYTAYHGELHCPPPNLRA